MVLLLGKINGQGEAEDKRGLFKEIGCIRLRALYLCENVKVDKQVSKIGTGTGLCPASNLYQDVKETSPTFLNLISCS